MREAQQILLVEDEALTATIETKQLNQFGYHVEVVATGEAAVSFVRQNSSLIDVILMDIDLGEGIDGTQAAEQILAGFEIPVVFLSSHTEPEIVERTEKITSYGYVVKNSGITVLDASIKMAFRLFEQKQRVKAHQEKLARANEEMEQANEELRQTNEQLEQTQKDLFEREEALLESQKSLAEAQRIAKLGSWELNLETQKITLSAEHQLMLGQENRSQSMPLSEYADKCILEEDHALVQERFDYALTQVGNPSYADFFEYRIRECLAGEIRTLVVYSRFRRRGVIYGITQDISEHKQAEARLSRAYQEKQILLQELQGRAKNSFKIIQDIINRKYQTAESQHEQKAMSDVALRIRSMSELYALLEESSSDELINLDNYLKHISDQFRSIYKFVSMNNQFDNLEIKHRYAVYLGLIVIELLTNAAEHAFVSREEGTVSMSLRQDGEGAFLEINDNGIGLPQDFSLSWSESLGLDLVNNFVEQLGARLEWDSSSGTRWMIHLPRLDR